MILPILRFQDGTLYQRPLLLNRLVRNEGQGSEHLFKDIYTAKADELYHHVLDKFGWAWRDPKYKSETELCAMLKWAKEKGLTIEELSI